MLSLTSPLISSVLVASAVLAVASSHHGVYTSHRRGENRFQLDRRLEQAADANSNTYYNPTWAGAVVSGSNGTFTSVTGTLTVPALAGEDGTAASAWVGIDGYACQNAILQTGVGFTLVNGSTVCDAWYEWYPDNSYDFSGIDIVVGDVIKLTVTINSTTSGSATIQNLSRGQTVSKSLNSTHALCQQNAEWIVEDFVDGNSTVAFGNFSAVTFTDALAKGNGIYTPSDASVVSIQQNDQNLTSVFIDGSSVTVQHV